jgi:hypothetical protein
MVKIAFLIDLYWAQNKLGVFAARAVRRNTAGVGT